LALESACRELEGEKKWLPDISEVLELIRKHQELWDDRTTAIWHIERRAHGLVNEIKQLQPQVELQQARAKWEQAERHERHKMERYFLQEKTASEKQEAAAKAAQEVEAAMTAVAEAEKAARAAFDERIAAMQAFEAAKVKAAKAKVPSS
jgi:hypothetical protein